MHGDIHGITGARAVDLPTTSSSTAITPANTDDGLMVQTTSVAAVAVTVPSGLRVGTRVRYMQGAGGQVSIVAGGGVTLSYPVNKLPRTARQYSLIEIRVVTSTLVEVSGDLEDSSADPNTYTPKLRLDERQQFPSTGISGWNDQSPSPINQFANATGSQQPAVGNTIGGQPAPTADGVNDRLASTSTLSAIVSASAHMLFAVFKPRAATATSTNGLLQHNILAETGGSFSLSYRKNGSLYEVTGQIDDGTQRAIVAPGLTLGQPFLVEWGHSDTLMTMLLGAGADVAPVPCGSIGSLTGTLYLFTNYNASVFANHDLVALYVYSAALTYDQVWAIRAHIAAKYGVATKPRRRLGRILISGDSVGAGYQSLAGGWRRPLASALHHMGIEHTFVGPYTWGNASGNAAAPGSHRCVSGEKASGVSDLQAVLSACGPVDIVIEGHMVNDLRAGDGPAATETALLARHTDIRTAQPNARIVQLTGIKSADGTHAADFDTTNAWVLSLGGDVHPIDISTATQSDGTHPDQTVTGYPVPAGKIALGLAALC